MKSKARKKHHKTLPIPEPPGEDAFALADVLRALVKGAGRGGLSMASAALGMTPSAFRKRLLRPGAGLDEASIKSVVLIADRKDENYTDWQINGANNVGGYVITTRCRENETVITWRLAPSKQA